MTVNQAEIWWADLGEPAGSEPGYQRPVVVLQSDMFNRSGISTIICASITSNLKWADSPGNVILPSKLTGLPKDSVAMACNIMTLDKAALIRRMGRIPDKTLHLIFAGMDIVLGR